VEGNAPPPRSGLILGKFLPPHAGHLHLIEAARGMVDELTVLVCSLEREPIPGAQRVAWVRELVPGVRVRHLDDELPSEPADHPRFWELWTTAIHRVLGFAPDMVFTSEDYGDELARRLGARHVMIDRARGMVPVSGTAIRQDPMAHWKYIPAPVRPWFVRRIVITGSESTGKTMLAEILAERFGTVASPEFARDYLDRRKAALDRHDVEVIAVGHLDQEARYARRADRVLFLDTDLLSTVVYGEHYYGTVEPWIERVARERLGHLYLLLDVDVPWVADPQRDRGDRREEMDALFRSTLERNGARYVPIRGRWAERIERAAAAVQAEIG
jgi:NadR type nicotinamide-nucleotide adenylyltransferase